MFNRVDVPNEEACPVSLDLLARLMRIPEGGAKLEIAALSSRQRVELALFCYRRSHLRELALGVAAQCTRFELEHTGGPAGAALYRAAHGTATVEVSARSVSLAGLHRKAS